MTQHEAGKGELLETVELEPQGTAVGTVIWLHGLGADAHDFEPIVPMLNLNQPLRFVFPNAPVRPVTINAGMEMRAWYDIDPGAPLRGTDEIVESARQIQALVSREAQRGIEPDKVTLAGFSQGGVIALQLGLRCETPFAGIMALSTYVHDHENLAGEVSFASIDVPIFMAHGVADPMIPIARAVTSREALTSLNYQVEWHEYQMGHQVCPEEIRDLEHWLNRIYP